MLYICYGSRMISYNLVYCMFFLAIVYCLCLWCTNDIYSFSFLLSSLNCTYYVFKYGTLCIFFNVFWKPVVKIIMIMIITIIIICDEGNFTYS